MILMCQKGLSLLYLILLGLFTFHGSSSQQYQQWPVCPAAAPPDTLEANFAQLGRFEVPATAQGCRILLETSNGTAGARVHRLTSNAVIAGVYDGSLGRPPAVVLQHATVAAAVAAATVNATSHDSFLLVPQGGALQLQGLLLVNVTLADPAANSSLALLPSGLSGLGLTALGSLKLWDVQLTVSQQQLQQYVAFFLGMPSVVIHTNGASYLYIHRFGGPAGNDSAYSAVVEAHSVTLISPEGASIQGTPLRLLQSLGSSSSGSAAGVSPAALAAAGGDAAGIVNATDNYILAATNATLLPLLRWLIGPQESFQPLVVHLASNVTLSPRVWGAGWPAAGLNITRQVLFIGSATRATSIDLGMDVGQLLLTGRYANVTLFNIALENLAYGDERSSRDADGNSILMPSQLWAFQYRRFQARVVLRNCSLVLPGQRFIDRLVYWANAFNSDLDFWRQQTQYMRNKLLYTAMSYVPGPIPGEYVLTAMAKADLMMFSTRLTMQPVAAPPLQLPFNSSIHQELAPGTEDIAIGPVVTIEDLAVTLYNINKQQYDCHRRYVLLPTSANGRIPHWGPADLDYSRVTGGIPQPSPQQRAQQSGTEPPISGADVPASLLAARAAWGANLSAVWPPKGGQNMVRCSVQFQGAQMVDVGFVQGMLLLQDQAAGSGQAGSGPDNRPKPLLLFVQIGLQGLPQGDAVGAAASRTNSSNSGGSGGFVRKHTWDAPVAATPTSGGAPAATAAGGSSWVSQLPAEAYTHLLWFITRNVADNDLVLLNNVTLMVPAAEAAQLAAAATAAVQASAGRADQAVLSMVYPTAASGPLPVVYRSLTVTNTTVEAGERVAESAAAAAAGQLLNNTPLMPHRHLLQQQETDLAPQQPQLTICAGSVRGLGISGTNVCMVAVEGDAALPPDYFWLDASSSSSSSDGSFPAWGIIVIVVSSTLLLATAAAAIFRHERHRMRSTAASTKQQHLGPAAAAAAHGMPPDCTASRSTDSVGILHQHSPAGPAQHFSLQDWAAEMQGVHSAPHTAQAAAGGWPLGLGPTGRHTTAAAAAAAAAAGGGVPLQANSGDATAGPRAGTLAIKSGTRSARSSHNTASLDPAGPMFDLEEGDQQLQLRPGRLSGGSGTPYFSQEGQLQRASTFERLAGAISAISADMHARRFWAGSPPAHSSRHVAASGSPRLDSRGRRTGAAWLSPHLSRRASPGSAGGGSAAAAANGGLSGFVGSPHRTENSHQQLHLGVVGFAASDQHVQHCNQQQQKQQQLGKEWAAAAPSAVAAVADSSSPPDAAKPPQQQQQQLGRLAALTRTVSHTFSLRRQGVTPSLHHPTQQQQQLQLHEVIGSGTFGLVYRATWRGISAAVKVLQLPHTVRGGVGLAGAGAGQHDGRGSKREHMMVMETALGTSISHPNIVQVYTYVLRPLASLLPSVDEAAAATAGHSAADSCGKDSSNSSSRGGSPAAVGLRKGSGSSSGQQQHVTGYELQLVMEYCPLGSLRAAIDCCLLDDPVTGRPHYCTVLCLALGVARAMHHLHSEGVLHGDLKAANVLLKQELSPSQEAAESPWGAAPAAACVGAAAGGVCGGLVAKVADLGLACMLGDQDTHISGVHRGTLSHMSPELLLHGHASRASDVYAMGILLWEMATGLRAFAGCPKAMLGAAVVRDRARPAWPDGAAAHDSTATAGAAAAAVGAPAVAAHVCQPLGCGAVCAGAAAALQPPLAYRQLTEACWAHEPQDRPTFEQVAVTLEQLIAREDQRHAALAASPGQQQPQLQQSQDVAQDVALQSAAGQATRPCNLFHGVGEVVGNGQPPPYKAQPTTALIARQVRFQPDAAPAAAAAAAAKQGAHGSRGQSRNRLEEAAVQRRNDAAAAVAMLLGVTRAGTTAAAAAALPAAAETTAAATTAAAPQSAAATGSPFAMLKDVAWEPVPE